MLRWNFEHDVGERKYQEDRYDVVTLDENGTIEAPEAANSAKAEGGNGAKEEGGNNANEEAGEEGGSRNRDKSDRVAKKAVVAAVFDGHGNDSVSSALAHRDYGLAREMLRWRAKNNRFPVGSESSEMFHDVDRNLWHLLRAQAKKPGDETTGGSTAIVAAQEGDRVVLYNVGDSRGVVVDADTGRVVLETNDHKPDRVDERARIVARGGVVSDSKDVARAASQFSKYGYSTSRSFGDFELKRDFNEKLIGETDATSAAREEDAQERKKKKAARISSLSAATGTEKGDDSSSSSSSEPLTEKQLEELQQHPVHDGVMSSTPEVYEGKLDLKKRHFIVLASDGIWDEIKSFEIGDWIRERSARAEDASGDQLAKWMLKTATERESDDNKTILVLEIGRCENREQCLEQMAHSVATMIKTLDDIAASLYSAKEEDL